MTAKDKSVKTGDYADVTKYVVLAGIALVMFAMSLTMKKRRVK